MALRRLSLAHRCLRAAVTVRSTSTTTESQRKFKNEKPMCPGNAFTLFLETQPREGKGLKKYIYEAACKWNKLSQQDKRIFQLQAKELEKKYKDEVSKWERWMQQTGHGDVVQRHRQLTDGKNLAIERSWAATLDQPQESLVTTEENVSLVMKEKSNIKETIKDETETVIKDTVKEGKNTLVKETEKEEKLHTLMKKPTKEDELQSVKETIKEEKSRTSMKETVKEEELHTSMKETEKEEKSQTSTKKTVKEEELLLEDAMIRHLAQSSNSSTSKKPFRSKQKQIVVVKERKSYSW
ncbi:hypothetical protein E2C01_029639 [Portunus trituberculatus]|uniref:HMG box domain-containing protein n=1 Tax=Portunus trituberculatus TaxID=210409 RepID=A0A5B7ENX1_PORTR|nr:hypothetical protein [Portunus trituberculatus]